MSFFINLGEKDGMDRNSLKDFISKESGIKSSDIIDVRMRNLNAYFDINKKFSSTVSSSFKGKEKNGRELRVNRDDQ